MIGERLQKGRTVRKARMPTGVTILVDDPRPRDRNGKLPWTPIREACSIVAIFSHRRDDGVWAINPDRETRQERKAARSMIRFAGGKVGVK